MNRHEITTVGKLREALQEIDDDTPILAQVCGGNSGAWNMIATIANVLRAQPPKLVVTLRHPSLPVLPEWPGIAEEK